MANALYTLLENDEETNEAENLANAVEMFLGNGSTVVRFPSFQYITVRDEASSICPDSEASLPLLEKKPCSDVEMRQDTLINKSFRGSLLKLPTLPDGFVMWALAPLATFSIIGVLIRFSIGVLFGPGFANVTNDNSPLFKELPANMVGSFFMGWVGAVFKKDIAEFSELLAIGLSTGLMGSITTFGSWNQSMLERATKGHWVHSLCSMLVGMELSQMSFGVGVQIAEGVKRVIELIKKGKETKLLKGEYSSERARCGRLQKNIGQLVFLVVSGTMWVTAGALVIVDKHSYERKRLWLSCVVAPPGTWARWFLGQLNGKGFGKRERRLRWLPLGTLITNISAATIEAALALVQLLVPNRDAKMLTFALQFGFLGCMSTVSTMVAEVYLLYKATRKPWRAYVYVGLTLSISFVMGLLIYSSTVWLVLKDDQHK